MTIRRGSSSGEPSEPATQVRQRFRVELGLYGLTRPDVVEATNLLAGSPGAGLALARALCATADATGTDDRGRSPWRRPPAALPPARFYDRGRGLRHRPHRAPTPALNV